MVSFLGLRRKGLLKSILSGYIQRVCVFVCLVMDIKCVLLGRKAVDGSLCEPLERSKVEVKRQALAQDD